MSATPSYQPTTADVTLTTLAAVLNGARAKCPEYTSRLDKAAGLLASGRVRGGETGRVWHVTSETDASKVYIVTVQGGPWRCNCPDFQRREDWCKHGLAVALLKRCQEREAPPPPPAPIPFPVLDQIDADAPIPFTLTPKARALLNTRA